MLSAQRLLDDVIHSLRNVIAPAISEPFPKVQAYMAAVILEFVARQVEERSDIPIAKQRILHDLSGDLSKIPEAASLIDSSGDLSEASLSALIEKMYAKRSDLGEHHFE